MGRKGVRWLYDGRLAREIVRTVADPPVDPAATRTVRPGLMTARDLARYHAPKRRPTSVGYRGLTVKGMAPPSSGGSTVGEALNILENTDLAATWRTDRTQAHHQYLEASALAFADRGRYLGDPRAMEPGVLRQILSQPFADERFCEINPLQAAPKPVAAGTADGSYDTDCDGTDDTTRPRTAGREGLSTTHHTTADRWGNVVSYTLTIEQTGGSAITVPNRGFLLNNELTDFSLDPAAGDPNAPGPGKRPR
jgi:gamma-glutamyltranspeptidase/glutathione hydrolase